MPLRDAFNRRGWLTDWDEICIEVGSVIWAYRAVLNGSWKHAPSPFHHAIVKGVSRGYQGQVAIPLTSTTNSGRHRISFMISSRFIELFGRIPGSAGVHPVPSELVDNGGSQFEICANQVRTDWIDDVDRHHPLLECRWPVSLFRRVLRRPVYFYGNVNDPIRQHLEQRWTPLPCGRITGQHSESLLNVLRGTSNAPRWLREIVSQPPLGATNSRTIRQFVGFMQASALPCRLRIPGPGIFLQTLVTQLVSALAALRARGADIPDAVDRAFKVTDQLRADNSQPMDALRMRIQDPYVPLRDIAPTGPSIRDRQRTAHGWLEDAFTRVENAIQAHGADPELTLVLLHLDVLGCVQ